MASISFRKSAGSYYTPRVIVRSIVDQTLDVISRTDAARRHLPRVLDPACGDGVFLVEASRWLLARAAAIGDSVVIDDCERGIEARARLIEEHLVGVDIDAEAVAAARIRLAKQVVNHGSDATGVETRHHAIEQLVKRFERNIRIGDTLRDDFQDNDVWIADAQEGSSDRACSGGPFDAIVGNPPYINIRVLVRTYGTEVNRFLRERFRCARGAYDIYVLFLERAFELLRGGGVCGMIVPNKLATLEYAAPCRALLQEESTVQQITDLSDIRVFPDADVYPYVIVWQKRTPPPNHNVAIDVVRAPCGSLEWQPRRFVRQESLRAAQGWRLHGKLDIESRVPTSPLSDCASISAGTTGFAARRIRDALVEYHGSEGQSCFDFIVSGNIDRYSIRYGDVRFIQRRFVRPMLPITSECLSATRRRLFSGPKIVCAGLSRRLEAAFDPGGLALGVQVYAVAEMSEDPRYLLALLNSKLLSYLFQMRFQAKRLAGGYLAVNKSQLAQMPIRRIDDTDQQAVALRAALIELVAPWVDASSGDEDGHGAGEHDVGTLGESRSEKVRSNRDSRATQCVLARDRSIDKCVYQLYGLQADEIEQLEAAIPEDAPKPKR